MDQTLKKQLEINACKVRMGIIEGVFNAKSVHIFIMQSLMYILINQMKLKGTDSFFQKVIQHQRCILY